MANTFDAPFGQSPKINTAVVTAAISGITTDAPTGAVALVTAGPNGAIVKRITAVPRATVTASSLVLLLKKSGSSDIRPIDYELMAAQTISTTSSIAETSFANISESTILFLSPGDELHVGIQVAQASGVVFTAQWMDY